MRPVWVPLGPRNRRRIVASVAAAERAQALLLMQVATAREVLQHVQALTGGVSGKKASVSAGASGKKASVSAGAVSVVADLVAGDLNATRKKVAVEC